MGRLLVVEVVGEGLLDVDGRGLLEVDCTEGLVLEFGSVGRIEIVESFWATRAVFVFPLVWAALVIELGGGGVTLVVWILVVEFYGGVASVELGGVLFEVGGGGIIVGLEVELDGTEGVVLEFVVEEILELIVSVWETGEVCVLEVGCRVLLVELREGVNELGGEGLAFELGDEGVEEFEPDVAGGAVVLEF